MDVSIDDLRRAEASCAGPGCTLVLANLTKPFRAVFIHAIEVDQAMRGIGHADRTLASLCMWADRQAVKLTAIPRFWADSWDGYDQRRAQRGLGRHGFHERIAFEVPFFWIRLPRPVRAAELLRATEGSASPARGSWPSGQKL